jgi:hypothetical protein
MSFLNFQNEHLKEVERLYLKNYFKKFLCILSCVERIHIRKQSKGSKLQMYQNYILCQRQANVRNKDISKDQRAEIK